jgi:hypothetical protein
MMLTVWREGDISELAVAFPVETPPETASDVPADTTAETAAEEVPPA